MTPLSTLEPLEYQEKITLGPEHPDCEDTDLFCFMMSKPVYRTMEAHVRECVSTVEVVTDLLPKKLSTLQFCIISLHNA